MLGNYICYVTEKATYATTPETGKSEHLHVSLATSDDWESLCWCTRTVASMHGPINGHYPWFLARKRLKYRITRVFQRIWHSIQDAEHARDSILSNTKEYSQIHQQIPVFTEEGRNILSNTFKIRCKYVLIRVLSRIRHKHVGIRANTRIEGKPHHSHLKELRNILKAPMKNVGSATTVAELWV